MATFRLLHFASPEILRAIDPRRLLAFLTPHQQYFRSHGIPLPRLDSEDGWDVDALVQLFMSPDESTPKDLIDALYYVDRMSTQEGMDALLDAAEFSRIRLQIEEEASPADIAVQMWLIAPDILERKQAEQYLFNPRSFEHYRTDDPDPPPFEIPNATTIEPLEAALNDWFENHKRGRTARIFVFPGEDAIRFMIRHGQPYKREASVVAGEPSSVAYRPLKYDVVIYDPNLHELRIHAQLKGERTLYREQFGQHLFGGIRYFLGSPKYTLNPLRSASENLLVCSDVASIEWIRLRELHYQWKGNHAEYLIHKANDLFAAMRNRGGITIPVAAQLMRAVFEVKYLDAKRSRTITIKPPNTAMYTRDDDGKGFEEWLQKRGFFHVDVETDDPTAHTVLARS